MVGEIQDNGTQLVLGRDSYFVLADHVQLNTLYVKEKISKLLSHYPDIWYTGN